MPGWSLEAASNWEKSALSKAYTWCSEEAGLEAPSGKHGSWWGHARQENRWSLRSLGWL